jgi:HK97 family phage major capsid protein
MRPFITEGRMAGQDEDTDERITDLSTQLEAAVKRAGELAQSLADDKNEHVAEIRVELEAQKTAIASLLDEQRKLQAKAEHANALASIEALTAQVEELKSWRTPRKHEWNANDRQPGQGDGGIPWAVKLWMAKKGDIDMYRELKAANKALSEGTTTAGGFLVPPQYIQDLVALRRATAPLRDWVTVMPVNSNLVYVPRQTTAELVAWTAENAPKVSTDEVFAQISVNIFTLAGIAKISNQLLEDASPMVDAVVKNSIGRGLGIEEDRAMINGSGTGQPTGILNSGATTTHASAQTAVSLYDDTLAAIGRVQGGYFGQPTAILMAPRTWSKLQTAKDTTNRFLGIGTVLGSAQLNLPGYSNPTGAAPGVLMTMFGIPVIIDANVPIAQTVSSNSDRSSIVVGAFNEAWLLERGGDIRMDTSDVAGTAFEQNQTWFRGEERVGFTAARLTSAFAIVDDVGP